MAVAGTGPGQAHPHGPRTSALAHVRLRAHAACTARRHSASLARWPATANNDESLVRGRASLRQPWTGPVCKEALCLQRPPAPVRARTYTAPRRNALQALQAPSAAAGIGIPTCRACRCRYRCRC
jgi:hypothetical protein